jgi:hypothetical protein
MEWFFDVPSEKSLKTNRGCKLKRKDLNIVKLKNIETDQLDNLKIA